MVSVIELEKNLYKLMIPITLFEKFSSVTLIKQLSIETFLSLPSLSFFSIYNLSIEIHRNIKKNL